MAQSFTNYELLIIGGASTGDTEQVAKQLMEQSTSRDFSYHQMPINLGPNAAHNAAMQWARGEFIIYHDDDDRIDPEFLNHIHSELQDAPKSVAFVLPRRHTFLSSATGDKFRPFRKTHLRYYRNAARLYYAGRARQDDIGVRRCIWRAMRLAPLGYKS